MNYSETIVHFFQEGGFFMYPIMFVLALGVAIALERYIFLTLQKASNRSAWNKMLPLLQQGKFKEATDLANKTKSAIGRILVFGLNSKLASGRRVDDIELAMEEGLMEIIPRLEKRTPYLATFANIATLLGLLGTILGLIAAFTAVANADPAEKANLLSQSISVAMNTTAFGLISAIPLLLLYSIIQTKTTEIVDSLEMASVRFINMVRLSDNGAATPTTAARPATAPRPTAPRPTAPAPGGAK